MKSFLLIVSFLFIGIVLFAQEVTVSTEKVFIDGQKFYLHIVESGQTVYRISKAYGVAEDTIEKYNPDAIKGIKIGDSLKIPVVETVAEPSSHDNEHFIYYLVKPQETVYSLIKTFQITEDEFYQYNPEIKENGLKAGVEIIIPKKEVDYVNGDEINQPDDTAVYYYHKVKEKETLFSISQQYDISKSDLKKYNKDVNWTKLSIGQDIAIPIEYVHLIAWPNNPVDTTINIDIVIDSTMIDSIVLNADSLDVLMLLPFNVFANMKQLYNQELQSKDLALFPLTESMLGFYSGALLALDSLQSLNKNIRLQIVDVGIDTVIISRLIGEGILEGKHVVFGPVYVDQMNLVKRSMNKTTLMINPFSDFSFLESGSLFIMPPDEEYLGHVAEYCANIPSGNYLIISDKLDEKVDAIENALINAFSSAGKTDSLKLRKIAFVEGEVKTLQKLMSEDCINYVLVPSHSETYIARILSKLCQVEDVELKLIGYQNWLHYNSIEPGYFSKLQFIYASPYDVDYTRDEVIQFIQQYREIYFTEPLKHCFTGYDLMLSLSEIYSFYISSLQASENQTFIVHGLASNYLFVSNSETKSIFNTGLNIFGMNKEFETQKLFSNSGMYKPN
jgi:LysM repeat protein